MRSLGESEEVIGMMRSFSLARSIGPWVVARLQIRSERGATAVEYGIMVALIAAVIILAVVFLGQRTSTTFSCTAAAVSSKNSVAGC
jgi:pilus assembly protein Flp/PilA